MKPIKKIVVVVKIANVKIKISNLEFLTNHLKAKNEKLFKKIKS